jgi:hypothetical protein
MRKQSQAQGETQLLGEWLASLPINYATKTHVRVGANTLVYNGVPLTPAQQRAFSVWSDWADARVATPTEVWLVEAKLVATGCAYGQVLDYAQQYPLSLDYQQFAPRPIVPVILAQSLRVPTVEYFARMGVRSVLFAPSFSLGHSLAKIFPAQQLLEPGT